MLRSLKQYKGRDLVGGVVGGLDPESDPNRFKSCTELPCLDCLTVLRDTAKLPTHSSHKVDEIRYFDFVIL